MSDLFESSRLKIEQANKHIANIDSLLESFIHSDFYDLSVEKDSNGGKNFLRFALKIALPADECALIIGDALHNLRSALDLIYYKSVLLCGGTPTKWTRFPVRDTREELISKLDKALKNQQISPMVRFAIAEIIKPYKTGNPAIWTLDDLNIIDKHQLLVPVLELVLVSDVRFEDEQQRTITGRFLFTNSTVSHIKGADGLNITLKDKGRATADILLANGLLKKIESIIPTLRGIAVEVTKALEQFEFLFREATPRDTNGSQNTY
jgi:hypothetical protein